MNLETLFEANREQILSEAAVALQRSHLKHYEAAGVVAQRVRLEELYELTLESLRARDLTAVIAHSERVADERYAAGFDIGEVQTAYNVLEERIWKHIVTNVAPEDLGEAVGLISTVLGAGKDALARRYVVLASHQRAPRLDVSALFKGTYG